jgi:hypothetical protein
MFLARFEPAIPASERPQTHALDRAATGIAVIIYYLTIQIIITAEDNTISPFKTKARSQWEGKFDISSNLRRPSTGGSLGNEEAIFHS